MQDKIHSKEHPKSTDKGIVPHAETMENIHLAVANDLQKKPKDKEYSSTVELHNVSNARHTELEKIHGCSWEDEIRWGKCI